MKREKDKEWPKTMCNPFVFSTGDLEHTNFSLHHIDSAGRSTWPYKLWEYFMNLSAYLYKSQVLAVYSSAVGRECAIANHSDPWLTGEVG